jgi:hypothetical protein
MTKMSLDSIGLAGFSHAFNSLSPSSPSPSTRIIEDAFASFANAPTALHVFTLILAPAFPILTVLPTDRNKHIWNLKRSMEEIGNELLERMRKEKQGAADGGDKSLIGLLSKFYALVQRFNQWVIMRPCYFQVKAESANSGLKISKEEVISQVGSILNPILCVIYVRFFTDEFPASSRI